MRWLLSWKGHEGWFRVEPCSPASFFTLSKRKGLPHPFRLTTAAIDDYWLSPLFAFVTTIGAAALAARRGWVGEAEEPTGQCDVVGPVGVGEEAVVTDAVEPVGQDMDQEAADELVGVDSAAIASLLPSTGLPEPKHSRSGPKSVAWVGHKFP